MLLSAAIFPRSLPKTGRRRQPALSLNPANPPQTAKRLARRLWQQAGCRRRETLRSGAGALEDLDGPANTGSAYWLPVHRRPEKYSPSAADSIGELVYLPLSMFSRRFHAAEQRCTARRLIAGGRKGDSACYHLVAVSRINAGPNGMTNRWPFIGGLALNRPHGGAGLYGGAWRKRWTDEPCRAQAGTSLGAEDR